MLITFEGGEGAGKTTLINKLYAHLQSRGHAVLLTHAPGGTPLGKALRQLLLAQVDLSSRAELLLFLADRAQHVDEVIRPALQDRKIVLCDRFYDSTVAYQGYGRGFPIAWVEKLALFAAEGLKPHLTIYLDIDPRVGLARIRGEKDRIERESLVFHDTLRAAYLEIAKKEPDRFHVFHGERSVDDNFAALLRLLPSDW